MTKEVSIALQTDKPMFRYTELAQQIELLGFDRISVYNDMLYQPAWLPLLKIAEATSQIKIGVAAVNPFTCHPINIAGHIALIGEIAPNRVYLGIARGAWLDYVGIHPHKPIQSLKDAFQAVNHFLSGSKEALTNEFFPVQGGDSLRWKIITEKVPMLLGTWGERTFEACYPFIEELKLGGTCNPDVVAHFKTLSANHALNSKNSEPVRLVVGAVTVVDNDGEKARKLAKKEVALYLPVVAKLDPTLNLDSDLLKSIKKEADSFNFESAAEYIDDKLLTKFAFAGTPDEIVHQSLNLFTSGAYCVEFGTPHGILSDKGIRLLGKDVLPELKRKLEE